MRRYLLLLLTCLTGAIPSHAAAEIPDRIVIPSRPGAVTFSHTSHAGVPCQQCHHTSTGARVEAGCRECHTKTSHRPRNSQQAFHDSCIGCHAQQKKAGKKTGPVKLCSQCHVR
ncbi:MAG: cytochrome c3 family protein [Pseudomonadota bacterium]